MSTNVIVFFTVVVIVMILIFTVYIATDDDLRYELHKLETEIVNNTESGEMTIKERREKNWLELEALISFVGGVFYIFKKKKGW